MRCTKDTRSLQKELATIEGHKPFVLDKETIDNRFELINLDEQLKFAFQNIKNGKGDTEKEAYENFFSDCAQYRDSVNRRRNKTYNPNSFIMRIINIILGARREEFIESL